MAVRFHVLGRIEVTVHEAVVDLGLRQRESLALMLLRANRTVTVDQLVEVSFADPVPESALRQVRNTVGRLRRTLAAAGCPAVIKTRPGGYLLEAGPDTLDLLEYAGQVEAGRRSAAEGRHAQAVASLRRGLALWRGPLLSDIDATILEAEKAGAEEARLAVLEECLELELRLGRHRELLSELATLTSEHPLRERMWELRMLALYRCGAKADALALYQAARRTFVAELGLEPEPRLARLEQAIITGDPALDLDREPDRPCPGQLPPDVPDFTGRDRAAAELEAVLRPETGPAMAMLIVTGKAGVGKTTLALHVAHCVRARFPDGQLFARLSAVQDRRVTPGEVLAQFLRALGEPVQDLPAGEDERAARFRELLSGRRVLVVLDDAVDEAQVRLLLPGGAGCAVLVTSRSRLCALPSSGRMELGELEPAQSVRFLAKVAGAHRLRAEREAADELVRLCGNLPLALRIAGARLAGRPHWRVGHMAERLRDERRRLDELAHGDLEVRSSIALSAEGLDPAALRLLSALALTDTPDLPGWTALAANGSPDLVDSLVDAQLLQVAGPMRYRLHDLVRVYARELGEPGEAVPRVLGGWLALVERAHRAVYGGDHAILHGTAARWQPPGLDIVDTDPLTWYEAERPNIVAAVRQAAALGLDELCWDLAVSAVSLFQTRGHYDDWEETHRAALTATRAADNTRGSAALLTGIALLEAYRHRYEPAATAIEEALELFERCGDRHGWGLANAVAAFASGMRGLYADAVEQCEKALEAVRQAGDAGAEILVLRLLGQLLLDVGHLDSARPYLAEALAASRTVDPHAHPEVVYRIGELLLASGRLEEAEQAFTDLLGTVTGLGDQRGEAFARYGLGCLHIERDRLASGEEYLHQAIELAGVVDEPLVAAKAWLALGATSRLRRDHETALHRLGRAERLARAIDSPIWQARALHQVAEVHGERGCEPAAAAARAQVRDLIAAIGGVDPDVEAGIPARRAHRTRPAG
ncbi:AfsR/SARP family transcriptional regulator [Nonomuraea turcica]|uniref:AfsR/SARP family transcriptional regulator n=1 Tax=Nonomuraea sp. G32 TaxID=3067274 RepID=UPI00273A834E|nr:BTAD domain-containing putative transcriptional regulator [Nonomuraea sp. G32]MDP4507298.1 BTAD domain-containing putative transcriptional regulator [Nonomuraea sp. G32]